MKNIESRKGISLVALVITIIVLVMLTGAVVITGINVPQQGQLAVFKNNVSNVQDAVTLKMLNNMVDKISNRNENVKWIGVVSGYTEASIGNAPKFGEEKQINGVDVAALDTSLREGISIKEEEFAKYYVDAKGIVYHTGFTYDGVTYYNANTSTGEAGTEKTLRSIAITTELTKKEYKVGETVDVSGLVVTATYSDGSTANVTNSCTFEPTLAQATASAGDNIQIEVSYGGKKATKKITIKVTNVQVGTALGSQITADNYGQAVNYVANGKEDWQIYYKGEVSGEEYVFLIASSGVGTKRWISGMPNVSEVEKVNDSTKEGYTGNLYKIMKLGQEGYTLNSNYDNSRCVADLVNNYGIYANKEGYIDDNGVSYVVGAIGGLTMELLNARTGGVVTLETDIYGYTFKGVATTGVPSSNYNYVWLSSPSAGANFMFEPGSSEHSIISTAYSERVNACECSGTGQPDVFPVVCIKASIPATWDGSKWCLE